MSEVLSQLIELLALERLEDRLFRGQSQDLGWGTVFGGQVLGQALSAATQTVPSERSAHSLHAYFLRRGDVDRPIIYEVDAIRDGSSFTTRRVVAVQKGRAIFHLSASFQIDEPGFEHQDSMPETPPPEDLVSEQQLARSVVETIPKTWRERALRDRPIELRPLDPVHPLAPQVKPPQHRVWYKACGELPDDPALHRYLLAYASDFSFLGTCLRPHAVSWLTRGMQAASLDHSMHFHRPFRMDEWLLYVVESPSASGARGLVRGRFFDRQGRLVCTTAQEGLMRRRSGPKKPQPID